jgi:hypothetical protein
MNIEKLKGPEKLLQMTAKHKSRERKSGFYYIEIIIFYFYFLHIEERLLNTLNEFA